MDPEPDTRSLSQPITKKIKELKKLDLSYNLIDAKACEVLVPVLEKMTALEELYLNNNKIV